MLGFRAACGRLRPVLLVFLCSMVSVAVADDSEQSYLRSTTIDWIALVPPPPEAGSSAQREDLAAVLEIQRSSRSDSQRRSLAIADSEGECFRFADVLGPSFVRSKLPMTTRFLERALRDGSVPSGIVKDFWRRPRPYMGNPQVERLGDVSSGLTVASRDYASYPSGHATRGTICAILLGMIVPESRAALFVRAEQYRQSRMIVGAHHPTDIEAGKALGTAAVALMVESRAFNADRDAAMRELREVLHLPAQLPARKEINGATPLARD